VWGNNFVGIAPPEYIRDVPCTVAGDSYKIAIPDRR
jgi:hypothetical protein